MAVMAGPMAAERQAARAVSVGSSRCTSTRQRELTGNGMGVLKLGRTAPVTHLF